MEEQENLIELEEYFVVCHARIKMASEVVEEAEK